MKSQHQKIPRFRLHIPDECKEAVNEAIEAGELAIGKHVELFEKSFSNIFGFECTIATSNGFSALHLVLEATIGRSGKEVLIPAVSTCYAVFNAVKASGNIPVLYDINVFGLDAECQILQDNITSHTKALITIPYFGIPIDYSKIKSRDDILIIEDASQAVFSKYENSDQSVKISTFSLYPTKGLVGFDGGVVGCKDQALADRIRDLRYYDHQQSIADYPRYNYKLNNVNAALALCYLNQMNDIVVRRQAIQNRYNEVIEPFVELLRWHPDKYSPVLQKYILVFHKNSQARVFLDSMLRQYISASREFFLLDNDPQSFPNAYFLQNNLVSVPSYEALLDEEIEFICSALNMALKEATYAN